MASKLPWRAFTAGLFVSLGVACASHAGSEPAAAPAAPPAAPPAPPAPTSAPEPEASTAPGKLPSEILSVPDKAWVFSFEGSAAYDKAKTACDDKFKDDPRGRARCITKARDAFTADAMEFTRDDSGHDVWVIYRTQSNKLVQVYSVQIEYGEQDKDSVNIKKLGREKGKPILFSGVNEFKVKLGGEYTLELQDATHGLLAYDARLGFISGK
jgi:hypothetical protein